MRDLGSRVLVLSVQHGRGKGSGVEVEAPYALLYHVHGGKITHDDVRDPGGGPRSRRAAGVANVAGSLPGP